MTHTVLLFVFRGLWQDCSGNQWSSFFTAVGMVYKVERVITFSSTIQDITLWFCLETQLIYIIDLTNTELTT